jgi:hypothetical protein
MVLYSYFCVFIASANGLAAALSGHNIPPGVQNRAAGSLKTKDLI